MLNWMLSLRTVELLVSTKLLLQMSKTQNLHLLLQQRFAQVSKCMQIFSIWETCASLTSSKSSSKSISPMKSVISSSTGKSTAWDTYASLAKSIIMAGFMHISIYICSPVWLLSANKFTTKTVKVDLVASFHLSNVNFIRCVVIQRWLHDQHMVIDCHIINWFGHWNLGDRIARKNKTAERINLCMERTQMHKHWWGAYSLSTIYDHMLVTWTLSHVHKPDEVCQPNVATMYIFCCFGCVVWTRQLHAHKCNSQWKLIHNRYFALKEHQWLSVKIRI